MRDILHTERLTLRTLRLSDAKRYSKYVSDWDVARMTGSLPYPIPLLSTEIKIEMQVRQASMKFPKFSEFRFTDPARKFSNNNQEVTTVFDGLSDANGKAEFSLNIYKGDNAPGKLRANFKTRVFEKGGDFSTINSVVDYNPYSAYTGVYIPKNKWGSKRISVDKTGKLEFAVVDTEGKPIVGKKMKVGIYRAEWRWWWDSSRDNVGSFASKNHYNALIKADVTSNKNGTAFKNIIISSENIPSLNSREMICPERNRPANSPFHSIA